MSVGLPFVVVETGSRRALARAKARVPAFAKVLPADGADAIYQYCRELEPRDGDVDFTAHVWFALSPDRPLAFFAGIWTPQWTSVRKIKNGMETTDLFEFLTTEPHREVGAIHPKAMPVILTVPEEIETWMTAPWE